MSESNNAFLRSTTSVTDNFLTDNFPTLTPLPSTSESSSSILGFISSITFQTWIIIILILAILGINIFAYLAKGTQTASNIFSPIFKLLGYETIETTKQTISNTATGTTAGVNAVATTATNSLSSLEQPVLTNSSQQQVQGLMTSSQGELINKDNSYPGELAEDSLEKALNNAAQSGGELSPQPLIASSSQTTGQSGWCYIGDDQGNRTCAQIGVNDVCMSGDVFPTQDVCVNPSLRA